MTQPITDKPAIVPQKKFETLAAFSKGQNNYYAHFLAGNPWSESRRDHPSFIRFKNMYSDLEARATKATLEARSKSQRLPYELLFETYPLMSQLVFADDKGVMACSKPEEYLIS